MKMKVIFWTATSLIFLFEGVMPAFTGNSEMAVEGIRHLGYPDYFGPHLNIMKILGAIALMVPMIKGRLKEWAYAGLFFDFLWAFISHGMVDGFGHSQTLFVLVPFAIWTASYVSYHKLQAA
jgi:hypothetical protein